MRSRLRRILAVLTIPAAFAAAVATSIPAYADITGGLHEANGPMNYLGSDDLNYLSRVEERNPPGRTVQWHVTTGNYAGGTVGQLKFTGASDRCLRASGSDISKVVIGHCSDTGTAWARDISSNSPRYINRYVSEQTGCCDYLSGIGSVGTWVQIVPLGFQNEYQKWEFS
jgi:hypothetical protein